MEDGWQQAQSRRRRPLLESPPRRAHDLSSLLEEEWFLVMVLQHEVDYGLQSCRLVCRRWYELCQQFPIKLAPVTPDKLKEAVDAVPSAASVSVVLPTRGKRKKKPKCKPIAVGEFFELLSSLGNLKSLEFHVGVVTLNAGPTVLFQSIPQLKQLEITFWDTNGAGDMVSSLRYLTELTRLKLVGGSWEYHLIDPFVELQSIRELDTEFFIFTDLNGNCAFPSLTNLTRLDLQYGYDEERADPPFTTEAVATYASTLEYLNLAMCTEFATFNFTPLTTLTRMKTLGVGCSCIVQRGLGEVLADLRSVTRLQGALSEYAETVMDKLSLLPNLRAFNCPGVVLRNFEEEDMPLMPNLAQTTELCLSVKGTLLSKLGCFTRLVHLELNVWSGGSSSLDDPLSCMPHLQTLGVELVGEPADIEGEGPRYGRLSLSGSALTAMSQLESVALDLVDVNKDFFGQLASTAKLKKLNFRPSPEKIYPRSLLSQINLLSCLEELNLRLAEQNQICQILSPKRLSKLKKLTVECSAQQEEVLRRNFARLRGVLINDKGTLS